MNVLWPAFLLLFGLIPLLVAGYILILRRRRKFAVRYSSLTLVRQAAAKQSTLRRHLPFILLLLALSSLIVAFSRPVAIISVPAGRTTIILTIDVSRSMLASDIPPNRLEAAEAAALSFIDRQDSTTQIGIVAFAGFAELIQPPTNDQEALQTAVQSLTTARRTAVGSGILRAIDAIAEVDPNVAPSTGVDPGVLVPTPVVKGDYAPDVIVVLTDGVSNAGPPPLEAAQQAVDRGVRVYTISFGTEGGSVLPFGGPFQGGSGQGFRAGIDENTLKKIADMTGGQYYTATSADELLKVFQSLPTYLITKHELTEISFAFVALGMLLAVAAMLLSLLWHPLP